MRETRRRFSQEEYLSRQAKVRQTMQNKGIDVLIVSDPSNMCWLSGYDAWSFYVHQCLVIGSNSELFWFGRGIDASAAEMTTDLPGKDILPYPDHYVMSTEHHPMDYLCGILKEHQLDKGNIGVEMDNYYFSAKAFSSLTKGLPNTKFVDATAVVNWQRAVKSEAELNYMRQAGKVIKHIYDTILDKAEPGMTKNTLVADILHAGISGVDGVAGDYAAIVPLIGAGEEAAACHLTWDNTKLENNNGLFFELAGVVSRYHCPCSRTLYFGNPPEKYRKIEAVINEAIEKTLPVFAPGRTCGEVAASFFDALEAHGFEKDNRCGYPIGLSYPPDWGERTMSLRRTDTTVLEAGMTFHFMPGMWFDDWGFETTESLVVTDKGGECLSSVYRGLLVKS